MWIAAVEMIPTDYIYDKMADIEEAIPISSTFEELGFEHHLILNNFWHAWVPSLVITARVRDVLASGWVPQK